MQIDEAKRVPFEDKTNYLSNFGVRQWTQVISYHFMAISLGNIPYNIIWMPLSVKAAAEGDRERESRKHAEA